MNKRILAIITAIAIISTGFAACSSSNQKQITTTPSPSDSTSKSSEYDYILTTIPVTDKKGNVVKDDNGNTVTEQVIIKTPVNNSAELDNDGYHNQNEGQGIIDIENPSFNYNDSNSTSNNTNNSTQNNNSEVHTSTTASNNSNNNNDKNEVTTEIIHIGDLTTKPEKVTESTTIKPIEVTTEPELTTLPADKNKIPLTSESGDRVDFSVEDQQIIKQMLEIPYLYETSYENADGVPINIASHVAIWMMQREGLPTNSYPEDAVVLNLFKFFGQTVINYKARCNNESSNENIIYVAPDKIFIVTNLEEKTHSIEIDHFEKLGNNNYYKVVAKVKGANGVKNCNAIIQRNKLDSSLGFSIKALNWS